MGAPEWISLDLGNRGSRIFGPSKFTAYCKPRAGHEVAALENLSNPEFQIVGS